ncbi:hypothetical protein C0J52_14480 [Blattella germanica]|nr:hypothetical protein C0J52_14480 [Blattella germanica]
MGNESQNGNPLIKNRFGLYLIYLQIAGIPIFMKEKSKIYFAYEIFVNICIYGTLLACWIQLLEVKHDLKAMMATLRIAMAMGLAVLIHFYIRIHRLKFEELIQLTNDFTWEELPTRSPTTGNLTAAGWMDIIRKVIKFSVICVLIFHAIQSPNSLKKVLLHLKKEAENVKLAAYEVCWIGAPISFQKSILLMITRTNQPFFLTAGIFVPVNNVTMMNILNESLSLFMFLLQMKVTHDEQD